MGRFFKRMKMEGVSRSLVIYEDTVTNYAKVCVSKCKDIMELWRESELLVNITKHKLVPEHVLLTTQEKEDLLKRYKLKETQLPRIQKDDPVAKFLGLARNDVVKIIRPSETAGRYITYRLVI
eukprot:TRINITY_DN1797_c0_g1_i10.p1 TRINITY_DN1797_c0_g1~~TRINITY_DN1797_c0_g1_i10.p1  ORF type:complete len:123 (+),score=15.42 TRINITY_DN1797_c0_g1_i10:375-743(+)